MPAIAEIQAQQEALTAIRRHIHAHPETGFQEQQTADLVADKLAQWGIEVHRGLGKTGVVGLIQGQTEGKTIGLRADMDALPMQEESGLEYASQNPGCFHGCGHDGHTTMLLGAAQYLAAHNDFAGTVVLIFQPAEEGQGGGRAMLADGLFKRFPCDEIYALHNMPGTQLGQVVISPGKMMAAAEFFDITIHGTGSHAAMPQQSRDPVVIAGALVQSLQTIAARNIDPQDSVAVTITQLHAGSAYNVIPGTATLSGTIRYLEDEVGALACQRMRDMVAGVAKAYDVPIDVDIRNVFTALYNHPEQTDHLHQAAQQIVGSENARQFSHADMGSEDFADMLTQVPGAYCWVGHGGPKGLHNPGFILDDDILPIGASILARVAGNRLTPA